MILPKRYDYLADDLVKMLKGEEIDDVSVNPACLGIQYMMLKLGFR